MISKIVGARAREIYDGLAKSRMLAGKNEEGVGGRGHKANPPVTLPEGLKGDSRDLAGKAVGVSGSYIDRASKAVAR
jgi:hypothetical protein